MRIPIAKPFVGEEEVESVAEVLRSGWLTQGAQVEAFEHEFAAYVGAEFACAVSSCTTALHLALLAVGVQPGDEIVTASHSFIASANAVRYCGAVPVFVDIGSDGFNIDSDAVEEAISERTTAIMCVHQIGMPCDMAKLSKIARRRGLALIEDAACAAGSEIRIDDEWDKIGKPHGDIACFSFHPRKILTTGDGGMITTANPDWEARIKRLRQHGMNIPDTARHAANEVAVESYLELGYNYRMTDIQAAVGRIQLKRLPEMVAERRRLAKYYHKILATLPGLVLPTEPDWARSNWQSYCVRLPIECDQRLVMQHMLDAGVATRRGVMCAHREPAYASGAWRCMAAEDCTCLPGSCARLVNSELAQLGAILIPLYHGLSQAELDAVAAALAAACAARLEAAR